MGNPATRALARSSAFLLLVTMVAASAAATDAADEPPVLVGEVSRETIEETVPDWVGHAVGAEIDEEDAVALSQVAPGASVTIYLGTWCSDSAREVPRFWRALDQVGGLVPFDVNYVAVDRAENRPPELLETVNLLYVPTFIVRREGREVGRVVESSPNGIETDLLALLTGETSGVLTGRDDL